MTFFDGFWFGLGKVVAEAGVAVGIVLLILGIFVCWHCARAKGRKP